MGMFLLASCQAAGEALSKMKASNLFSSSRETAMAEAAARGQTGKVKELLDLGVDVNVRGNDGVTPLMWALVQGSKPGFKYLLEHGANPNLQTTQGDSVMELSSIHEDPDYLALALKNKGDPNLVNPETAKTPIFTAMTSLRAKNIQLLIEAKTNLNFQDRTGATPMMRAAAVNRYDFVYAFLKAGADPAIENNWGNTIVHFVKDSTVSPKHELYQWRAKVIELLKEKGVKVD
jgi:ankyrin repeat protein